MCSQKMVKPAIKKQVAGYLQEKHELSKRRSCGAQLQACCATAPRRTTGFERANASTGYRTPTFWLSTFACAASVRRYGRPIASIRKRICIFVRKSASVSPVAPVSFPMLPLASTRYGRWILYTTTWAVVVLSAP